MFPENNTLVKPPFMFLINFYNCRSSGGTVFAGTIEEAIDVIVTEIIKIAQSNTDGAL
jgi:hypothetical protein